MADTNKPVPNKKITLPQQDSGFPADKNLLILFALMGVALFLTPLFTKKPEPAPAPKKTAEAPKATPAAAAPAVPAANNAGAPTAGTREENFAVETPLYKIVFSNKGGVVQSWILKQYKDSKGKPLDLVNTRAIAKTGAPLSLAFPGAKPETDPNYQIFAHKFAGEGNGIDFEFADAKIAVKKSFRVSRDRYQMVVKTEVLAGGAAVPHNLNWRGGFGDLPATNASAMMTTVRFETADNKLVLIPAKESVENQPKVDKGTYMFAGIQDAYFAAVFLPTESRALEHRTYVDTVPNGEGKDELLPGASVGTPDGRNEFTIFAGPKDLDVLEKTNARLPQIIDWGTWFGWAAKPLFYALRVVHGWVKPYSDANSWGWAIILITVIINFALLPLKVTSLRSMKKMSALQPEMAKINKKYEGLSLKDPRMQNKNEEIMGLYKKHGVNPLGGCFPMMLQMPFLIALYTVLTVMIDLRQAQWLWVMDLSQPETLAIRILPVLMIASQFLIQKMTPAQPGADPAQQRMMMFMPLMFGFMFYSAQSGLVLYWLVGNLVAIGQQWAFNKFIK